MSRYIQRVLGHDEKLVYTAQLHWFIYLRGITLVVLGAMLGSLGSAYIAPLFGKVGVDYLSAQMRYGGVLVILFGFYLMMSAYIRQISTELVITSRRVIAKYGFIATTTYELMLSRVEGANIDQTILGRMMGFGTILVKGTGGGISPIDHIASPYLFHNHLMTVIERGQDTNNAAAG